MTSCVRDAPRIVALAAFTLLACSPAGPDPAEPPALPGPEVPGLVVDPDRPHWLQRSDGRPFFLCGAGDPEDFFYRGAERADGTRDGDQDALIEKLAASGANGIYVQALRSHGGDGDATHNPFIDHDPDRALNPAILAQWDGWIAALNRAGVVVYLFVYDDGARPWRTGDRVTAAEQAYVETLVDRLEHHPLLLWVVAEEYSEGLTPRSASRIAALIAERDDFHHPIAIHQLSGFAFDFPEDAAIDQFAIQTKQVEPERLHAATVAAFQAARGRYGLAVVEIAEHGTGTPARLRSWAVAMGGAYVMVYEMDIRATAPQDLADCGRMVAFFEAAPFRDLSPRDELAGGEVEYVLASPDGRTLLAYSSRARHGLGLETLAAGNYLLRWYSPRSGAWVEEPREAPGGPVRFALPAEVGPEVALLLTPR